MLIVVNWFENSDSFLVLLVTKLLETRGKKTLKLSRQVMQATPGIMSHHSSLKRKNVGRASLLHIL